MSAPTISGYTFVEHLGSGGFADVYCYQQQWPAQRVAIKVVRAEMALSERERGWFTSEANAMARLGDHPNIVPVLTAGTTADGRPFLVMRYCPPPDLGARVRSHPLSVGDALSTGIKLASAIETAHRAGTVHRDIKPSNVLITSYHEPALTDFGIAGRLQEVASEDEVRISYPWSPPELLDGRSNGSVSSDVYSLGATIWHLLVGRSPFALPGGDNSTRALTARILHAASPATHRADVPAALDRLLQQTMAKQPSHRPASAIDLARALQRLESAAGFSRTAIAVVGARGPGGPAPGPASGPSSGASDRFLDHADPDQTMIKPAQVVPEAPAVGSPAGADEDPERDQAPAGRWTPYVWTGLAIVAAAVTVVTLVLTGGGDGPDREATTDPTTALATPAPIAPEAPTEQPTVTGTLTDQGIRFRWESTQEPDPDDSWEWQRPDSGESERTDKTSLTLPPPKATAGGADDWEVCLQVRLIRDSFASPWARECVRRAAG